MATFAKRVKEQRIKKGLSQPQLAEDIGLTKQTISSWERGVRRPDFETMNKLAQYFGVNMAYLVGQSDDPTVHEPTEEDASDWVDSEVAMEIEGGLRLNSLSYVQIAGELWLRPYGKHIVSTVRRASLKKGMWSM